MLVREISLDEDVPKEMAFDGDLPPGGQDRMG